MKWVYVITETQDGKTLNIYEPFSIDENEIKFIDGDKKVMIGNEIFNTPDVSIHENINDALKLLSRGLIEAIKWMRDDNCAPPLNPRIYDDKCVEALANLEKRYGDEFPELFI